VNEDNEKKESELGQVQDDPEMHEILHRHSEDEKRDQHKSDAERHPSGAEVYTEGNDMIIEDEDGEVLTQGKTPKGKERLDSTTKKEIKEDVEHPGLGYKNLRKKLGIWRHKDEEEEESSPKLKKPKAPVGKRGPAMAYQFGNTVGGIPYIIQPFANNVTRSSWKTKMAKL
jgi:hypothetical protein